MIRCVDDLAQKLHVDPYSSDPILTKKLNQVAWVMFSARMTVDAAMMAVPGSMIISSVEFTDDLVYQTPKADLIMLVQKKLKNIRTIAGRDRRLYQQYRDPIEPAGYRGRRSRCARRHSWASRGGGRDWQHDDGVPGALPGYFAAHARPMEPAKEPDYQDSGSGVLVATRSEWHHDNASTGRLPVMDAAHRGICDRSPVDGAA